MKSSTREKRAAACASRAVRILLILVSLLMLYPLIWNVYSSFKTNQEFLGNAFSLPASLEWDNYARAISKSRLPENVGNSLLLIAVTLTVMVLCVIPCSYCLARYRFFGAKMLLHVQMAAIFIQATVIMVPLFLQMNMLGWLNNRLALGVLYATMQFPFSIFLLCGFLRSVPADYDEAAMIDGCGPLKTLLYVVAPMAKAGLITIGMITAMSVWNEYPMALVMLTDPGKQTLPVGLAVLYEVQRYATDWTALFAALVLALIPTLLLFLTGQKQLIQGMNMGGLKG